MKFPIIRIKEGDKEHIVGTNSHDCLYIDNNTIHYLDVQSSVGTQYPEESGMYFKGEEDKFTAHPEVEFLSLEKIIELATKNMKEQTEETISFYQAVKKYEDEKAKCQKKLDDCKKETGVTWDSSGKLF